MSRSERWATSKEIKKVLTENGAGPVLYCEKNNYYTYDLEGHQMFLGQSGTGKTRRGLIPLILSNIKHHESIIVSDPKGEIYENTIDYVSDDYNVYKFDFRHLYDTSNNTCWNPLRAPYDLYQRKSTEYVDRATQMIEDLSHTMYPIAPNTDPFWMSEARNVFEASVFALFDYALPEQVNLSSVYYMIERGDAKIGNETYLQKFVSLIRNNENIAMQLTSYITTANDTRGGIRSSFLNRLSMTTKSESIRQFLSRDDININNLRGDKPVAIYIILPDETPIYEELAGVLISQLMNHYFYIAENKWGGKLPIRVNFCLDELGNIGKSIGHLDHVLSAGRSRNIRVAFVLQSIAQLDDLYGPNKAVTIRDNVSVKILYRVNHWGTLQEFSKLCGDRITHSNGNHVAEPLITATQLAAMDVGQALVIINGRTKFITWLPDFTQIFKKPNISRIIVVKKENNHQKVSTFNIQETVKEKTREHLIEMMTNANYVSKNPTPLKLRREIEDLD